MTLLVYFQRVKYKLRMVQQNGWVILLFNGKVGDVNIYSLVLATNSYGESWDSSCEKYRVPVQKH